MADDIEAFLTERDLSNPTLIGHSMGAKTAMVVALRAPERVGKLIAVDNAPVDAALQSDFAKYVQGMRRIEESHVQRQSEADDILREYEEVLVMFLS